jgi:Ca2+-binding EF-hand superfamily protein
MTMLQSEEELKEAFQDIYEKDQTTAIAFKTMLKALQEIRNDPKHKNLSGRVREIMHEALAAAE